MKFLELTEWGNKETHLISLNGILDITFSHPTKLILIDGSRINVIENESTIKEMLKYLTSVVVSEENIVSMYNSTHTIPKSLIKG